jgi:hypothetical protein
MAGVRLLVHDITGRQVTARVHFYRLEAPSGNLARRAVVVR